MNNLVSIIIPVWNCEKYLGQCLDSILKQTYKNLEIILVDDGSTDGSLSIMKEYEKKDNRIIAITQKNSGPGIARNTGFDRATGKYICFIDSDDYVDCDFILKLVNIIDDDCLYSYCAIKTKDNDIFITPEKNRLFIRQCCYNKLYNAKFIKDIRFSDDKFAEDLIFNYKEYFESDKIKYINEPLYFYRINENSVSNNWHNNYDAIFNALDKMVMYKDITKLDNDMRERLEFALIWYCIYGNFRRAGIKLDKDYIVKSVNYISNYFPYWYKNKYIEDYVWDKEVITYLINKDYDSVINFFLGNC